MSQVISVFRFEKKGVGPYNASISNFKNKSLFLKLSNNLLEKHKPQLGRPGWKDDITSYWSIPLSDYCSACESIESLKFWFKDFLTILKRLGFKIVEYKVNKKYVKKSKSGLQLIFIKDQAISSNIF